MGPGDCRANSQRARGKKWRGIVTNWGPLTDGGWLRDEVAQSEIRGHGRIRGHCERWGLRSEKSQGERLGGIRSEIERHSKKWRGAF